jgi:hypothetical protein
MPQRTGVVEQNKNNGDSAQTLYVGAELAVARSRARLVAGR